MILTVFTNQLNHHQAYVADELFSLLNTSFHFVETEAPSEDSSKGSKEDFSTRPYLIQSWKDTESKNRALYLSIHSDVAVFGASALYFEVNRARNTNKLTFDLSERWLKRGIVSFFSPRLLKHQWYYHTLFYKKPIYKLCASGFAARDQQLLLSFQNRCYKWGYFPRLTEGIDTVKDFSRPIRIMWCARFLKWKHPELAIQLAKSLIQLNYNFTLDMYGEGREYERAKALTSKLGVSDYVHFWGSLPNEEIMAAMRDHDLMIITSDKKEGWGAVANEAMSNGCLLIASDSIGATPFLIKHGDTGLTFKSSNLKSLVHEVCWVFNHPQEAKQISLRGECYIRNYWNPLNAALSLLRLSDALLKDQPSPIKEGPCSLA